jgi:hypothetical protein
MTTYYKKSDKNEIIEMADFKFADDCLEALEKIDRGYDGKLYFVSQLPVQPIQELKNLKLRELDMKATEYMLSKYPDYKQNNIAIFGTDTEKKEFQEYYDAMKTKYTKYRGEILYANTKEELDEVEIEF